MLSGALAVMVDRKEIKWTIYCVLWGWAQAEASRMLRSSSTVIAIYSNNRLCVSANINDLYSDTSSKKMVSLSAYSGFSVSSMLRSS